MTDYSKLPANFQGGMQRYIENGIAPGSFLTAVLQNDLCSAIYAGTPESIAALRDIVTWLDTEAPCDCYGSLAAYQSWRANGGFIHAVSENVVPLPTAGRWMRTE